MKALRIVGYLFVLPAWFVLSLGMRAVIAMFTFLLLMLAFLHHIGLTYGPHMVQAHIAEYAIGILSMNAIFSMLYTHGKLPGFTNWMTFVTLSTIVNFIVFVVTAHAWPETIHTELLYAFNAAVFFTFSSLVADFALQGGWLEVPPLFPGSQQ